MKKHSGPFAGRLFIMLCSTLCSSLLYAQTDINIAAGAQVTGRGGVQVTAKTTNFVNDGVYFDTAGTFNTPGGAVFSGSGTITFNKLFVDNSGPFTLNASISVHDTAELLSGVIVTVNTGATLNVKKALVNNGSITGAGKISMNGASPATISGIGSVNNLDINNAAGVTVNSASKTVIRNVLSISAGTLATGDSIVLASDSLTTARIVPITTPGAQITGKVQVRQYINGGHRAYRFWGHPFSTAIPLNQIEQYIDITGVGGATNGFTSTVTNAPSCFRYNPMVGNSAIGYDPGWRPFTSVYTISDTNGFHQYEGIRLFIRGAKGAGLDGVLYTPAAVTIGMSGPVNQGNQIIYLKKGSGASQDYNQVANPYPSPVDIGTVAHNAKAAGNIAGSAIYVWDPYVGPVGQFMAVPITSGTPYYLQSYASFQVRAAHNGDTLNFIETNKASASDMSLLRNAEPSVSLSVYDMDYHLWDIFHMQFADAATDAEDNDYDAQKPAGPSGLNFYSWSADSKKLAIDTRPFKPGSVIPLGIRSDYAQEFIIKAEGIPQQQVGRLFLHDKLLQHYTLLCDGTEYRFAISNDKTTQGDHRFELSVDTMVMTQLTGLNVAIQPNPATTEVIISITSGKTDRVVLRLFDLAGVCVYDRDLGIQNNSSVTVPVTAMAAGMYMVELTQGEQKVIKRLVKE